MHLPRPTLRSPVVRNRLVLFVLALVFYGGFSLHTPALLDDADSVHAEVAREMLLRHDWVTLYANGIRYLEKAPLLYWSMAASMRLFGVSAASARLPLALTVLALALALEAFARRIVHRADPTRSARAGLLSGLITLSSFGIFIFTRITIPDAMVCLWLTLAILCFWRILDRGGPTRPLCWGFAAACALGVLTKGLIGAVFPLGIVLVYLLATDGPRDTLTSLRQLFPASSTCLFLLIAAPWHILAGLRNPTAGHPGGLAWISDPTGIQAHAHLAVPLPTDGNVHGWFWFYFVNEHLLRYLNLRVPRDYDTVPLWLFLGLIFIWLLPWSAFLPHALAEVPWRFLLPQALRRRLVPRVRLQTLLSRYKPTGAPRMARPGAPLMAQPGAPLMAQLHRDMGGNVNRLDQELPRELTPAEQTLLLLGIWATLPLAFFSLSTRQEYYVLPALPAMILLIALWLTAEAREAETFAIPAPRVRAGQRISVLMLVTGTSVTLACGFFVLHAAPPSSGVDLAGLLAQNPADYALSFGHFLDLNARALGLFRAPLLLTAATAALGSLAAWWARRDYHPFAADLILAAAAFSFLAAAHAGLRTFAPVLSSAQLAAAIEPQLKPPGSRYPDLLVINGEYESGSTLGFYLHRPDPADVPATAIHILNGRSSNLWYGSFFPDAPPIFETGESIRKLWAGPQRVFLWTDPLHIPPLPGRTYQISKSGGKEILSNQPNPF